MIFINNSPDVPKKFSSISKAIASTNEDVTSALYWLLGEGFVNFNENDQIDETNDFKLTFSYNSNLNKYLITFRYSNTEKPMKISFSESDKSKAYIGSLLGNSFYNHSLVFDDNNLLSANVNNKAILPLRNLVATNVPGYSSEYFSSIYVNGVPQPINNIQYTPDEAENSLNVGFSNVYGGSLVPDPINVYQNFDSISITGGSPKEWVDHFSIEDTYSINLKLKFSNLSMYKSPRYLVAQVTDLSTQSVSYIHIPKNFANTDLLFYYIDEFDDDTLVISIDKGSSFYTKYILDANASVQTNIKFMLLSPLEGISPFTANFSGLSRKYKLPYKNLSAPDALTELKVLAYDSLNDSVFDISLLNTSLLGSLFSLDYQNGILEILNVLTGQITTTTEIFAYNIKYVPPLQIDYTGDFSSNITVYGTHGSTYVVENAADSVNKRLNLPSTLYVWAYLKENPKKYVPIVDEKGLLSSKNQYTELDLTFFITKENEYTSILVDTDLTYQNTKPINIGYLNLRKPSEDSYDPATVYYIFKLNSEISAPYARFKSLLDNLNISFSDYKVYKLDVKKEIFPKNNTIKRYYKVAYLPKDTEIVELFGYIGRNKLTLNDTGNVSALKQFVNGTQVSYSANLKIVDALTLEEDERFLGTSESEVSVNYTGQYISLYDIIDIENKTNISSEYIELVSRDRAESTVFAPKILDPNKLDLIGNKVVVLEFNMNIPNDLPFSATEIVCNLNMEFYFKFTSRIVNYRNTL